MRFAWWGERGAGGRRKERRCEGNGRGGAREKIAVCLGWWAGEPAGARKGGWRDDLLWRAGRRGGIYAADAEASLGLEAGGKWARAKAVASHRTPYTLTWLGSLWGFADEVKNAGSAT
jgi:hypothetical protein